MKDEKYISIGFKFSLMVFIMIFVSASVIGVTSYFNYKDHVIAMAGNQALGVADSIASAIDGDEFSRIDKTNLKNDYYYEIYDMLSSVKEKTNFAFVYTMVDTDEKYYKYVIEGAMAGESEGIRELGDLDPKENYGEEPLQAIDTGKGTTSEIYYNDEEYGYLVTAFSPIFNVSGQVVGVVGVDIRANSVLNDAKAYIPFAAIFIVASSIILFLISLFITRKTISVPLKGLMEASDKLAVGDTDVNIVQRSKDEIGQLMGAFGRMVENIENQSKNVQKVAEGDLSINITPKSDKDILAKSMKVVVDNLNELNSEVNVLTESVMEGNLSQRADTSKLEGKYKDIVEGINYIQDAFINVLDSIEATILIIDKEHNVKFGNVYAYEDITEERKEMIGRKCHDLYECDLSTCQYEACMKTNKKQSFEDRDYILNLDYQTDLLPYNDKDGNLRGIIEVGIDISRVKHAERVAKKQLDYQESEINKVIHHLSNLANGKLSIHPSVAEADEDTEAIAENFNKLNSSLVESTSSIKSMVDEVSKMLLEMSNKNLSQKIKRDYVGDFTKLKDSINHIVEQFNVILTEINTAAEQVEAGAEQVASSSQNLSQGASEQASSVEEMGATITEVADQTNENAKNADEANKLSLKSKAGAQTGNTQMQEMLSAMNDIKDSSRNIANIIKVIDEIAFQTNILALNAAVEAARAGEHGKGFAVVAEEVRNLAARSAKAAKETTDLIDNSINKVDEGYKIANNTAEALNKIVAGVSDTVDIVSKIAQASNQQATAISEINSGIEQISGVTQTNTSTAEESASASEEMAAQAQMLKGLIQQFKLSGVHNNRRKIKELENKEKKADFIHLPSNNETFGKY